MSIQITVLKVEVFPNHRHVSPQRQLQKVLGTIQEGAIRRSIAATNKQFGPSCDYLAYFADPAKQIYQISQWITPLEALADSGKSVGFAVMDPYVAREFSLHSNLPIFLTRSIESYEDFVDERNVQATVSTSTTPKLISLPCASLHRRIST